MDVELYIKIRKSEVKDIREELVSVLQNKAVSDVYYLMKLYEELQYLM